MPREKNTTLRVLVPILAVLAALGVSLAVLSQSRRAASPPPAAPTTGAATEAPQGQGGEPAPVEQVAATSEQPATAPAETDAPAAQAPPAQPHAPPIEGLRALTFDGSVPLAPLGTLDPSATQLLRIDFTPLGAGVEAITLSRHFETIKKTEPLRLQERRSVAAQGGGSTTVSSLAARGVEIDGTFVDLFSGRAQDGSVSPVWRPLGPPGAFEAVIVGAGDARVARVVREYVLAENTYDIEIRQRFENLSDRPLAVRWFQYGPVDLPLGDTGYVGDKRRVRFGHLLTPRADPSRQIVATASGVRERNDVVELIEKAPGRAALLWPGKAAEPGEELVWAAMTNRYFAFAVHPLLDPAALAANTPLDKDLHVGEEVYGLALGPGGKAGVPGERRAVALQLNSERFEVAPGASLDLSLGAYAGPLWRKTLDRQPHLEALGLGELILYNIGGPCAFCTFQWLANGLFAFLALLHDYVVFDWAIAIMLLVVAVRTALHPITRRSQIGLLRFSKQMQAIAPKQQKLREKFGDDPKRLQQEMMKLYREENVKFTGALGCLPMFLQSPIWIALYAMLFFAFDLRHEPAFFGVIQAAAPGWSFLADLSAPDRFVDFGRDFHVPLISGLMGPISSINVLPLVLGVVFFVQQKYLTPPPSTAMTPEQEMQQRIMKVMMVVLFPLFMYNAPSGLALYFITNSVLGILESRYIRSHVDKMELEPPKKEAQTPGRRAVANEAKPGRRGEREGSPWKSRDGKK